MQAKELSGSTLAYLGDAVLSLMVREYLVELGYTKAKDLQEKSIRFVSAKAQARIIEIMLENGFMDEVEMMMYLRGRNHKSGSIPKNTDVIIYRKATGFESVWGYWYITKNQRRLEECFELMKQNIEIR